MDLVRLWVGDAPWLDPGGLSRACLLYLLVCSKGVVGGGGRKRGSSLQHSAAACARAARPEFIRPAEESGGAPSVSWAFSPDMHLQFRALSQGQGQGKVSAITNGSVELTENKTKKTAAKTFLPGV